MASTMQTTNPVAPEQNPDLQTEATAGSPTMAADRRSSADEWDASKVPPSRFQKRKGSIYATPGSRDGHVDKNYATEFHEKIVEKGYDKLFGRRGSKS